MLATSFRSWVWPALSNISANSALRRQRTPLASSSRSTSLICRSAVDGAGPDGSTRAARLLTTSIAVTATTKTTTTARMPRAKTRIGALCNFDTSLSRCGRTQKGKTRSDSGGRSGLYDLRSQDIVQVDDAAGALRFVDDDQTRDRALHDLQRLGTEVVGTDGLGRPGGDGSGAQAVQGDATQVQAAEIAVGDHAYQPASAVHHRRHAAGVRRLPGGGRARARPRHFLHRGPQRGVLGHHRERVAAVHEVGHAEVGAPAQR